MLVISTQNWSFLAKFAPPKTVKLAVFYRLFLDEISREISQIFYEFAPENPSKFDFFLLKCREIGWFFHEFWLFPAKIPQNWPIFPQILTFSRENPTKLADFSANFDFFSAKSADFSANLPLKIPRNFAFFSAKYQKPWRNTFAQVVQISTVVC